MSTVSADKSSSRRDDLGSGARRTYMFVGGALACLAVTALFELSSRPAEIKEYGKVGQEFYPEFTDPTVATSLSVKVVDAEELKPLEFAVKQADSGRWVIPSHHDYPADAEDQLAETASSVIGIKRDAMVSRWASDHTRYGVVDPDTDTVGIDEIEGIGKRLTFRGEDDTVLASYIIGKKVDEETAQYYVRHPAEDETYIAELDIKLSTKFSDWVKTDLLDITNTDVRRVSLNDYSFEERGPSLAVTETVVSTLTRESATADWEMADIDPVTQEVNADAIRETVDAAADLAIVGVRPKQPGLTADLQLDRNAVKSQRDVDRMQSDLLARGFLLQPSKSEPEALRLVSREGEMSIGTEDGLRYMLHFGRVFTGSDKELEIGLTSGDADAGEASDEEDEASKDESDAEGADEGESGDSGKPGRYVFVRVEFDETLLGEKPAPVDPEMPEELKKADEEAEEPAEEETAEDSEGDDSEGDDSEGDETEGDETAEEAEDDSEAKLQEIRDKYNADKQKYDDDVRALEDFDKKATEAKEKAENLNRRFAQWYYVIPGDSYDKLALSREDLVKAKGSEETEAPASNGPVMPDVLGGLLNPLAEPASDKGQPELSQPETSEPTAESDSQDSDKEGSDPADSPAKETDAAEETASSDEPASTEEPSEAADESEPSNEDEPAATDDADDNSEDVGDE